MSIKNIWYISKYALAPVHNYANRPFFFSKYMARNNRNVTLVSSRSVAKSKIPGMGWRNQAYYECEGVNGVVLNGPPIKVGFNFKRIFSWMLFEIRLLYWALFKKKNNPDLIIVSSLSLLTFLSGVFLKRYFKCKLICEVRDIWPLTLVEAKNWNKSNLMIRFLAFVERLGYHHSDAIIGSMPNLKEHVYNISPKDSWKVHHIPMGFDPDFGQENELPEVNDPFEDFFSKIPSDNFIVGYAGTLGLVNCVDQIIQAAIILRDKPVLFAILGKGVLKNELINMVEENKLTNVFFLDAVPKQLVLNFLKKCDILVNPWKGGMSIYKYGVSPNKWIDYMYSARPVLVSLDGFHSIINEAECGKIIRADDPKALAKEIELFSQMDKKELDAMGKKGKMYLLNKMTCDILTKKYLSIIDGL